jgi:hypothetical protein
MTRLKFALEEDHDYWHKSAFLHYLHEFEPQVEQVLSELCEFYKTLFGKHESFDRGALLYPVDFQELYSQHFSYDSWQERKESAFSYRVSDYLAKSNELLRSCLEYRRRRWNEIKANVQEALSDPVRGADIRKISSSEDVLTGIAYREAAKNEEHLRLVCDHEELVLESLDHFRRMFFEKLITRFHIEKNWLCLSAFVAIQEGKSRLEMPHNYTMHLYPVELLRELYGSNHEALGLCYFPTGLPYPNELPRPPAFQFDKSFGVYVNADDYESQAVAGYREHVRNYIEELQRVLRSRGYKLKRRNVNYSRIKWLIRWTVQGWTMNQILDEYTQESGPNSVDPSTVWKAFKSFESYDLPVIKKRKKAAAV